MPKGVRKIKLFRRNKVPKEIENRNLTVDELLLQSTIAQDGINKTQVLSIPSVSACIDLITGIIGGLNIKLYSEIDGKTTEIKDKRTFLLNKNTGDTLNPIDFKKALLIDYLLEGKAFAYINRIGSEYTSLNYVKSKEVQIFENIDVIFKDYDIYVQGNKYLPYQFIKLFRNTNDGHSGSGIIAQNNDALNIAYLTMQFEKSLLKTGGNKRGFLKSARKLTEIAMDALKAAWARLYSNTDENMIILNDGLEFQEASNTSVELQLNENKKTNNAEICKILNVPSGFLEGSVTEEEHNSLIKTCILPLLSVIECALNSDMLTEVEKENCYWQFDTKIF